MKKFLILSLSLIPTLVVMSGCSNHPQLDNAQYWQRKNVSESVYLRGTKAQQILNQDIAACVTELKELERLGQIKDAIPTQYGHVMAPHEIEMLENDSPERDGALFAEQTNYHDFNGCMRSKGWERTYKVSFDTMQRARETYEKNHILYKNQAERPAHDSNSDHNENESYLNLNS